ncbi:DUF317 domain-containing protein [Streptomyces sp. NPDC001508]|uniref:DUF317 domain-containing protein n=1 Tax=Streptomyces sp. NPDC001508 TaxID=3154656 RepID=UPI0033208B26
MQPDPDTTLVAFIGPRHLAGGGDPAWITVPLHRACGWSYGHDPLMPRVILSSPNQKALLRLEPDPEGQWWTIHHNATQDRPAWYASFGARTPVEIIAGFTDALTAPAAATTAPADPYEPLERAGWSPTGTADGFLSPDGRAMVQRTGSAGDGPWFATVALPGLWQAQFDEHTPPHLIAAFTAALADSRPVPRTGSPLRFLTLYPNLVTRIQRDVPAAQVASVLEERVRALAARRAAPPTHPSAPRRPPPNSGRSR